MNIYQIDKSCPGGSPPCSDNGQCDHTNGLCACNEGNQGFDCSGKILQSNSQNIHHIQVMISFSGLTCPGDCSDAGICDTTTGQCSCDTGRHGLDCSSK